MSEKQEKILRIKNLSVDFKSEDGSVVHAVRNVNLYVRQGKTLGVVGESGCGKSVTVKSILWLHNVKETEVKGEILFKKRNGEQVDITKLSLKELQQIRGNEISMIFQDPMTYLNPVIKVGVQVAEALEKHQNMSFKEAKEKTIHLFHMVGIRSATRRFNQYPQEFSGGMQQRILIAMALACNPSILLADEPTTALDVTIQAQILRSMKELQAQSGMSIIFITHNLGVVAHMCDDVAVMYAGQVVEYATTRDLSANPLHPYTQALMKTIPRLDMECSKLEVIEGMPPKLKEEIIGCAFAPRCKRCVDKCLKEAPEVKVSSDGRRMVKCHMAEI